MKRYVVVLRDRAGKPYQGTVDERPMRVVVAKDPEGAVHQAFPIPPSSHAVADAWVAELAEPYAPVSVPVSVPRPSWAPPEVVLEGASNASR